MPDEPIIAINVQFLFVDMAIHLIGGSQQNLAMQVLEAPAAAESARWPASRAILDVVGFSPRTPKSLGVATSPRPR